jgi:Ca2+-transporting ATPase
MKRLTEYGKKKIVDKKKKKVFQMLFEQLTNFMILILSVVAIISGFIGGITDTLSF